MVCLFIVEIYQLNDQPRLGNGVIDLSQLKITKWFSFLQSVLKRQLGQHPLIVLKDMKFCVLKSLIEFMYCGETSVTEENLNPLMEAAKFFEVSLLIIVEFITGYY